MICCFAGHKTWKERPMVPR